MILNLAACVKASGRDREKKRCSFWHCPVYCLTSDSEAVSWRSELLTQAFLSLWYTPGLASAAYVILISYGLADGQPLMYFILIFCVLVIFDPVGWLVCVWGDWYHEDKGVRSVGCHALFPPRQIPPKFSHLIPAPRWQPNRRGPARHTATIDSSRWQ